MTRLWRGRDTQRMWSYLIAGAGACFGATVSVHPSGWAVSDHVLAGAMVGIVSLAATGARRSTWLALAAITAAFAEVPWASVVALVALLLAAGASWWRKRLPVVGSVVGALGALAALRLVDGGRTGVSAILALAAVAPVLASGYRHAGRPARRRIERWSKVGVAAVATVAVLYGVTLAAARGAGGRATEELGVALQASRQGDFAAASEHLARAMAAMDRASGRVGAWWVQPVRALPVLGPNADAVTALLDNAKALSTAAAAVVGEAESESLALRGGRVDPEAFARLDRPIQDLVGAIDQAVGAVESLDSPWLVAPVADRVRDLDARLGRAAADADLARETVRALPQLLGGGGDRRYLVLFVTPVEARATGFPGNFAELTVTDGQLAMPRFGRVGDLLVGRDDPDPALDLPAEFLERYERFGILREWRSVTTSPHFPAVADLAAQLYAQTGGQPVDGVLTIDPAAIAALLHFTGPIAVPEVPEPLSAENAERFLLLGQYVELPGASADTTERVDALESLGRATFDRLVTGDLPPPQELGRTLAPIARAGHMRFVVFDPVGASFLARIGLDHPLPVPEADGLAVTSTNVSGGKVDQFLHRTVDYDVRWDPATGAFDARVAVRVRNDSPSSGLPDYVIGDGIEGVDLPPGTNRSRVSIYSPGLLQQATLDGRPLAMESSRFRGYYAYGTIVELAPGGGEATIELHLSGALDPGQAYGISVWNQVLVNPDRLSITVEAGGGGALRVDGMTLAGRTASVDTVLEESRRYEVEVTGTG